jgi:hypothetical protein
VHTVGFRVLYVLFFISHDRRELIHLRAVLGEFDYYNLDRPHRSLALQCPFPGPWPATDRAVLGGLTTCMRAPHELGSCFAPPSAAR